MKKPGAIQILIVDDDADLLLATKEIFNLFGYKTTAVTNAEQALAKLKVQAFEIVLTDIRLPKIDGVELLKEIRRTVKTQVCVFLTSGHHEYEVKSLYNFGATGFFQKPMDTTTLRDTIIKSLVPRNQRWSQKIDEKFKFRKFQFRSFQEMLSSGQIRIGIGGLRIENESQDLRVGDHLEFQILFQEASEISELSGTGIIRWLDAKTKDLGLEITFLEDACRFEFCQWLNTQTITSYIPA